MQKTHRIMIYVSRTPSLHGYRVLGGRANYQSVEEVSGLEEAGLCVSSKVEQTNKWPKIQVQHQML